MSNLDIATNLDECPKCKSSKPIVIGNANLTGAEHHMLMVQCSKCELVYYMAPKQKERHFHAGVQEFRIGEK